MTDYSNLARLLACIVLVLALVLAANGETSVPSYCVLSNSTWRVPSDNFNSSTYGDWGDVSISGNGGSADFNVWDLEGMQKAVRLLEGSTVSVSCLTLSNAKLLPPTNSSAGWVLPFFELEPSSQLSLKYVNISTDCQSVFQAQQQLCALALAEPVEVGHSWVHVHAWSSGNVIMQTVNLSCSSSTAQMPPCQIAVAAAAGDVYSIVVSLQDPAIPLTVLVTQNITFHADDWPSDTLTVLGDVKLAALKGHSTMLDFSLQPHLFTVAASEAAFLSFDGFLLLNLPLVYLPLDHPRRHMGILSTGMWAVNRNGVFMHLNNVTLVLTMEEFEFWQYWITLLASPLPSVRALANWTTVSEVQIAPSGDNYIYVKYWKGRYSISTDVRWTPSTSDSTTASGPSGVLGITGTVQVPPTAIFQIKSTQDFSLAVRTGIQLPEVQQYGLFIIFAANITLPAISVASKFPDPPLVTTTDVLLTAWPGSYAFLDMQLHTGALTAASGNVRLRNLVLLNAGNLPVAPGTPKQNSLSSGLWFFKLASERPDPLQTQLRLENVIVVVSPEEVQLYYQASSGHRSDASSWMRSEWIVVAQVHSSDKDWIFFSRLSTARFDGINVNITSKPPDSYVVLPLEPPQFNQERKKHTHQLTTGLAVGISVFLALLFVAVLYAWKSKKSTVQLHCSAPEDIGKGDGSSLESKLQVMVTAAPRELLPPSNTQNSIIGLFNCCLAPEADPTAAVQGGLPAVRAHWAARLRKQSVARRDPALELQRMMALNAEIQDQQLQLQHSLGWGGHGVVYKGTWKGLPVAIKVVLIQGETEHVNHKHLLEAAISSSLIHPNIVATLMYELKPLCEGTSSTAHQYTERSGDLCLASARGLPCWKLYMVQEFCDQGTLKSAVDQGWMLDSDHGTVDLQVVLQIATDIASGLAHIHSKNIIHGDLTPSNVLLQSHAQRPEGCIAKVADFGLSVRMEQGQTHRSHAFQGTPHYIAPEVLDRGILGKPADIYAFGVLLWELYNGMPPWRCQVTKGSMPSHQHQLPIARSSNSQARYAELTDTDQGLIQQARFPSFARCCPYQYAALAARCMHHDPTQRPSINDVLAELKSLAQHTQHSNRRHAAGMPSIT